MNKEQARRLVSRLNGNAYIEYVHQLFTEAYGDDKTSASSSKLQKTEYLNIDPRIFQVLIPDHLSPPIGIFHYYNVYIPHPLPLDLLNHPKRADIISPILMVQINQVSERYLIWSRDVFPTESDQLSTMSDVIEGIYFLTNFCDIPKKDYLKYVIPKYRRILNKLKFTNVTIGAGSPDTFFEHDPQTAKRVFESFLSENIDGICINIPITRSLTIDYFTSEKYLSSGVSRERKFPSEPLYIDFKKQKKDVIREFEDLLSKNPTEEKLEFFLKANYKEIFGPNYDRIETQLWLRFPELDAFKKNRRLDIFLRNSIINDWELIELKRPIKLTYLYRNIPVLSKEIYNAIQQLRHYERLLKQEKIRKHFVAEGIEYFEPELKVIIGRKPQISQQDWRWLIKSNEKDVKIITYDDLIAEMKARLKDWIKPVEE